ncbi:Ppx/GppA family phosphatase [Neobacillus niacini]|uniref:Ppx/GppA family phosphatase n=1 Tax=Neobacillus niacini TaxID=86668 RepID=UPI00286CC3F8|nr:Ppx/GppA family phosphatase [Neobacillus niacini]
MRSVGCELTQKKYAIIDIGSNTIRLVIYRREQSDRLKEIENVKAVARLRNFLSEDGFLAAEGITKLIEVLQVFQEVTRHHNLKEVKCVATATIRQAKNNEEILTRVNKETDFTMRVLSEYEEAYYGFLAVIHSTTYEHGITIDIGGASTEITYFENRKMLHYHSFPFGALSLKKQFIKGEIPEGTELVELRAYLQEQFNSLEWIQNKQTPVIGIGGSARNLVHIHQEYTDYPLAGVHQYLMMKQDINDISYFLQSMTFPQLQRVEGLSKDRADIIIPAIEVFAVLMDSVQSDKFVLSQKGLRDGLFYEQRTGPLGIPNVLDEAFNQLAIDYSIDVNQVNQITNNALEIAQLLNEVGLLPMASEDIQRIKRGSFTYNLGTYIDSESSSQHTFYILANRTIDGMHHRERVITALIASYKNKAAFKRYLRPYSQWFTKEELATFRLMGAIIKFAYSLNATKRNIIDHIHLEDNLEELVFSVYCHKNWKPEEYQVEKQKKHLEKLLDRSISVQFFKTGHILN